MDVSLFSSFVIVVYVISAVFRMLEVTVIAIHSIHSINNSLVIEYCIHDIWGWQHYFSLLSPFAFSDAEISLAHNILQSW